MAYNKRKSQIFDFIKQLMLAQNKYTLFCLVRLWQSLALAAKAKPSEEEDLVESAELYSRAIVQLFRCDSMDLPTNVDALLQPSIDRLEYASKNKYFKRKENERYLMAAHKLFDGQCLHASYIILSHQFLKSRHFFSEHILGECLNVELKSIFGTVQVSNTLDSLFWGNMTKASR